MTDRPTQEQELSPEIYQELPWPRSKIIMVVVGISLLAFMANISLKESIRNYVSGKILNNPACPVTYQNINVSFFLPKVILDDVLIDGLCFNSPGQSFQLKKMTLKFWGPSLLPPGILLKNIIENPDTTGNVYFTVSFSSQQIKLSDLNLGASTLNQFIRPYLLAGHLNTNGLFKLSKNSLEEGQFHIKSRDLQIPAQTIFALMIPDLPFKDFSFKGQITNTKELQIQELIFGDEQSPIRGTVTGKVKLNMLDPKFSELDLTAEIRFVPEFLDNFTILKVLLASYNQKNGFYQIKLTGPLGQPMPRPL
jgi:type II secretion system protein N